MKKLGYVLLMVFGSVQLAAAQQTDKAKGFDPSRLFAGGNFGLSFGSGNSLINISPQVGYHFSPQFAAGAGVSYIHYSYIDYADFKYSESYAGMNLFGRFYPIRQFFIQAQPELDYVWGKVTDHRNNELLGKIPTQFVPCLLLGGGAAIPAGRGALTISLMYDVVQNLYSPYYHQAVYGLGYNIGF